MRERPSSQAGHYGAASVISPMPLPGSNRTIRPR